MKLKANVALIVIAIVAGILVILSFALFIKTEEKVTLPLTVYEYADFQCPACGYYYPMVLEAVSKYSSDNVDYQFKHLPLTSIHPYAYSASIAAEAAREQGKFSEYANLLMDKNREYYEQSDNAELYLSDQKLIEYAAAIGLDLTKFNADLESPVVKARVDADVQSSEALNISSTPSFVINGKIFRIQSVDSSLTEEEVKEAIIKQFTDYIDSKLELAKN